MREEVRSSRSRSNCPELTEVAGLHGSSPSFALSPLRMPALSPTMESGTITSWNIKPGTSFSQGDILLTIETDKAEVDVEAQDDGVMGKQVVEAGKGSVKVGEVIAVLGEEEGEVDGAEPPEEWSAQGGGKGGEAKEEDKPKEDKKSGQKAEPQSDSKPAQHGTPKSKHPLSPAVLRLLLESCVRPLLLV